MYILLKCLIKSVSASVRSERLFCLCLSSSLGIWATDGHVEERRLSWQYGPGGKQTMLSRHHKRENIFIFVEAYTYINIVYLYMCMDPEEIAWLKKMLLTLTAM